MQSALRMKNWIKQYLLIAVFITVTGLVMAGLSYTSGAKTTIAYQTEGNRGMKVLDTTLHEERIQEPNLDSFTKLAVNVHSANVNIRQGDRYSLDLSSYSSDLSSYQLEYTLENGTLTVTEYRTENNNSFIISGYTSGRNSQVVITLPEGAELESLSVDCPYGQVSLYDRRVGALAMDCSYGDLEMKNVQADTVQLDFSNGDALLQDCTANTVRCNNSYGSLSWQNSGSHTFERLELRAQNADFSLSGLGTGTMDVENNYGSLSLANITTGDLTVKMNNGDFWGDNVTAGDVVINNQYGDTHLRGWSSAGFRADGNNTELDLVGSIAGPVVINNDYGTTRLQLESPQKAYDLNIYSYYGDIRINGKQYEGRYQSNSSGGFRMEIQAQSGDVDLSFAKE